MARKVFDTYHSPEEEVEGVRQCLDPADIPWFETHKGFWWLGSAAIWVSRNQDYDTARSEINAFQANWRLQAGPVRPEKFTAIRWIRLLLGLVIIAFILYFSLFWFWL